MWFQHFVGKLLGLCERIEDGVTWRSSRGGFM